MKYKVVNQRGHCFKIGAIIEDTGMRYSSSTKNPRNLWNMRDNRGRTNWVYIDQMVRYIPELNTKIKIL